MDLLEKVNAMVQDMHDNVGLSHRVLLDDDVLKFVAGHVRNTIKRRLSQKSTSQREVQLKSENQLLRERLSRLEIDSRRQGKSPLDPDYTS